MYQFLLPLKLLLLLVMAVTTNAQVKMFEPDLISDNKSFGITIAPNGKELFYVKSYGGRDTLQLYTSKKIKGRWQPPQPAPFADTRYKQIDPAFSPDGKKVLFNSMIDEATGFDIYISNKTANGWSVPQKLSDSINTASGDFYATISNKKNIYFTRRTKSNDIYVSYYNDGGYRQAVLLDSTVNTDGNESNPYISPDESFLIFFADYKNGQGQTDLYVSFKKGYKWSYPLSLGTDVNSKAGEFCPAVDFKNKLLLFSRTEVINNKRIENIYTYPLKKIKLKKLKSEAVWP